MLVICLSDDNDDQDDIVDIEMDVAIISPVKPQESSSVVNNNNNKNTDDPSAWVILEKDIIHPSALPSKYSDIYKRPFEIRCSAIRFGIAEFNVDTELVLMHPTEFEMKLTGKKERFFYSRQIDHQFIFRRISR